MLKKIISIMLIVDIVSTCLNLSVSAAKYPVALTGWTASFYNTPDTGWTEGETGVELTTDPALVAHGKASLHLFCEKNLGNLYARAVQNVSGLASGKTYRLTGKVNASGTGWRYCLKFGSAALANIGDLNGGKINEWTDIKHDFEFTYDSKELTIHLEAGGDIYADNLSLREIISGEGETAVLGPELLTNGDFEMDFAAPEEAAFVQAAPANGVNYLNVKTDLGVKIYQKTDSGEQLLELGDPIYSNSTYKLKVYQHSGLTNGQNYCYVVRTTSANGIESDGKEVAAIPLEIYDNYVSLTGWTYKNSNKNFGKVTVEEGKGRDGSAALQASNMTDSNANSTYLYITNQRGVTLEPGKIYQLSYWEKDGIHNELVNSMVVKMNNAQISVDGGSTYAEKNKNVSPAAIPADGAWHKQVLYLKPEAEKNSLEFQLNRHYEQMLLDDFELYEVDEQLNVVVGAKNLMADCNGDFEVDFAAPEEAAFVQTAPANGVNYLNVKTDLGVKIYQKTDSGEQLLELGDPVYEKTNYNLKVYQHSGLINGQEYRYIVRTVGVNGKESEGTAVSATPLEKYNDYVRLFGWTYKNYNNNYGKVTMEQGKGIDGSTALQASNMTDSNANSTYLYITNQRGFTLESGKTYQLSYWEKDGIHNSMQDSVFVKVNNSKVSADGGQTYAEKNKNVSPPVVPADGTWHKQVLYLKPEAEKNTLELQLNRHYEQMLLDDFELYEVDEQLNVVVGAKNLMADCNGDFEDISDTKELAVSFRYYPAYSDEEHYGEIMDPSGISALKELAGYDTDVLRAEMKITNTMYRENKDFVLILAVYKGGILYEMPQSITATAAYGKTESLGFDYRVPDLATGEYSIKMFIWDGVGTLIPLAPLSAIEEN